MAGAEYVVTVVPTRELTDDELRENVGLANVLQAEAMPEDAPFDPQAAIRSLRASPERLGRWHLRARSEDGSVVAYSSIDKDWDHDENPEVGGLEVDVHPEHRGRGVGTAMLAHQIAFAQALGETRLLITTSSRFPAAAPLVSAMGAQLKSELHVNELTCQDLDLELLQGWIDQAATRSSDYQLQFFEGAIPDDVAAAYVELVEVMNTAPRDALEINDFRLTVERLREGEGMAAARGDVNWTMVATHRRTGELVGLHTVGWAPSNPKVLYVGSTGVQPAHRGAALGKWLKAELTVRALERWPGLTTIRTTNADSNEAMLGINRAMGYQPSISLATWEIQREAVEQWLAQRRVRVPDVRAHVDAQRP